MTPEQIAAGLTGSRRMWLPHLPERPVAYLPIGMAKRTRDALVEAGLLVRINPPSGFGMVRWHLSDLGLAVRRVIMENEEQPA